MVVERTTSRLIEVQIWQAMLEGLASEHSMRMLAMKNATDNANDLIDDYTLELQHRSPGDYYPGTSRNKWWRQEALND